MKEEYQEIVRRISKDLQRAFLVSFSEVAHHGGTLRDFFSILLSSHISSLGSIMRMTGEGESEGIQKEVSDFLSDLEKSIYSIPKIRVDKIINMKRDKEKTKTEE